MRFAPLALAFLLFTSFLARAEEPAGLSAFAEQYWSAIRSEDPEKIFALYDPQVLAQLSPAEAEFLKKVWMQSYAKTVQKQGDSYQITSKTLPTESNPLPTWRWAAKPQFQIEIQTFRKVGDGQDGLTTLMDMVVQKEGKFFIIRPVPPEEMLQKQLQKKAE